MHGNCKCGHHVCAKILVVLAWLAGIGFVISAWKGMMFWKWDANGYFEAVVVFVVLAFSTKFCKCCWDGSKMMAGGASCACNCDECGGGKCGGMHKENHQHM